MRATSPEFGASQIRSMLEGFHRFNFGHAWIGLVFLNSAQNPESSYLRCISVIVLLIVLNLEFSGLLCRRYARFFVIECVVGYMSMLQSAPQNGQVAWVWRLACLFYLCLLLLSNWNHKYYWSINVKLNHSVHFTHSDLPRWRLHNWFD